MIHDRVKKLVIQPHVAIKVVAVDGGAGFYMGVNLLAKGLPLSVRNYAGTYTAFSLQEPHYDHLAVSSGLLGTSGLNVAGAALAGVHVTGLAPDEGLVYLDGPFQLPVKAFLHGHTDAMEHEPCGLLSHPERPVKLPRTDAVAVVGDHPHSGKPLIESKRGILKNGPDFDRKLRLGVPSFALPEATGGQEADVRRPASRTGDNAIRPSAGFEELKAVVRVGKVLNRFEKGLWIGCHDSSIRQVA